MSFLKATNVSVRYPFQKTPTIQDVTFDLEQGERTLILGPSGGGKSTLALALNGMIPYAIESEMQGEITVDGFSLRKWNRKETAKRIGILFQDPSSQFCMLHVEDEILFGMENVGVAREEMTQRATDVLKRVGLEAYRHARLDELSGGMQQKLGLACLLALDPDVFILDEPTANLDPQSAEDLLHLCIRLAEEEDKTLIVIEHRPDPLIDRIHRVLVLDAYGNIIADRDPRSLFQNEQPLLKDAGIRIPTVCEAASRLSEKGMSWPTFPLNMDEWTSGLQKKGVQPWIKKEKEAKSSDPSSRYPRLELNDITFAYDQHPVLRDVTLSVYPGEWMALLGPNGSGKSTLTKLMIRLLEPSNGTILFDGSPLERYTMKDITQRIGYVFQNPEHQFIADTVEQELAFDIRRIVKDKDEQTRRIRLWLERLNLWPMRHQNPFTLSQGQKRRLSVATMLSRDQDILILDEPSFGLDQFHTDEILQRLQTLKREGKTIITITHDMASAARYADRAVVLLDGSIPFSGTPDRLFTQRSLWQPASLQPPLSTRLEPWIHGFTQTLGKGEKDA